MSFLTEILDELRRKNTQSSVTWNKLGDKPQLEWTTEADVQVLVNLVIGDAIVAAQAAKELDVCNGLGISGLIPDISVVVINGISIGIGKIKKLGSRILDNPVVLGQVYDYLCGLSSFYGIQAPMGFISTYQMWRLVWLPAADNLAASSTYPMEDKIIGVVTPPLPELSGWGSEYLAATTSYPDESRILHGTEIIDCQDPKLPDMLVSLVLKMQHSKHIELPLLGRRLYLHVTKESMYWAKLKIPRLNFSDMPGKRQKNFVLLRDLFGGNDGRVWLVCTTAGTVCVIKFFFEEDDDAIATEVKIWNNIWQIGSVRKVTLLEKPALVMPYVKPCNTKPDWDTVRHTKHAVKTLAGMFLETRNGHRKSETGNGGTKTANSYTLKMEVEMTSRTFNLVSNSDCKNVLLRNH